MGQPITFMTYYVELSKKAVLGIREASKEVCKGDYQPIRGIEEMLAAMFESAKHHHPEGRFVLVTDERTKISLPHYVEVFRKSNQSDYVHMECFLSMMSSPQFLSPESHLILLDPDIIIMDNLENLFESNHNVYFTYQRDSTKEGILKPSQRLIFPINMGIVALHKKEKLKEAQFFLKLINICRQQLSEKYLYWFGLQIVVSHLFFEKLLAMESAGIPLPYTLEFDGLQVGFVDADIYNYPPGAYCHIPLDVKVAHFKGGDSKKRMLHYWESVKKASMRRHMER